jgi:hypothetical protein
MSIGQPPLSQRGLYELRSKGGALDRFRIALQHLELSLAAVAPEADVEAVLADT